MPAKHTSSSPATAKHYHHGDLRRQLVEAAARLLKEEGEAALSMRRLAQELTVSRTAPYHHFADKHALLCAIAEEGFRRLRDRLENDDFLNGRNRSKAGLHDFLAGYIHFALQHREYYELMFGARLWKSQPPTASLKDESRSAFRVYVEKFRLLRGEGRSAQHALRDAQVSWSTLHGMSRVLIDGIYLESDAIDEMCKAATNMMWTAFHQA